MKRRFTILTAALALLTFLAVPMGMWGQTMVTYKLTIDANDFNSTSYDANNTTKTSLAVCTTDNTKTYEVSWTSYQVMLQSGDMQWQKNTGKIYNSTDLGTITNVTVTSSAGTFTTYYGTSEQPAYGNSGEGKGFFKTFVGNATGKSSKVEVLFEIEEGGISTYTLTYNRNGANSGNVPIDNTVYDATNNVVTVVGNTGNLAKEHYSFGGWNTKADGTGTNYVAGDTFIIEASTTLYAKWNLNTHTASFSVNGTTTTQDFAEGAAITFPADPVSINEKVFIGWTDAPINGTQSEAPDFVTSATMGTSDVTFYAVFATADASGEPVETKSQTLQYDTWSYSGSTTDKSSYRLFHSGSYIESAAFDLSKLSKVVVYGGTFGGSSYNSLTIGDGTNVWKNVTVSGSSQTGLNTYTGGTALSGTKPLRIISNSGTASGTGIRISKVEIYTLEPSIVYSEYCTTVEVSTDPSVTVTPSTIDAPFAGAEGTLALTYENIEEFISFAYYFCDANGNELEDTDPNYPGDWIDAEINDEDDAYTLSYIIGANDGAARTAYMKVYTFDDNEEEVYAIVTVNQAQYVVDYAELPFAFNNGKDAIEETNGLTQSGLASDYADENTKLKFDSTDDFVILKINERPGILTFYIKGNSFSGGTFKVQTSADGVSYSDLKTYTTFGNNETYEEEFDNLGENVRYIKWIYTNKVSGNVGLGNIALAKYVAPPASITVSNDLVEVDAEEHDGTLDLTYESLTITDMTDFDIQFCDANGDELSEEPDWIEVLVAEQDPEIGEGYVVSYYMVENEGPDARTAYFKVYAMDDETNLVYSNLVTISQAAPVAPVTGDKYVKVTSTDDLTSGQYLIVYEEGSLAFDGGLETLDAASNTIEVTINDDEIGITNITTASEFTIDVTAGTIMSASGYYIGQTSDANGLASSTTTAYTNTISFDEDGNANIVSEGAYLRYNSASNQTRFRYYKSSSYTNQKAIQLYKKEEATPAGPTITVNGYGDTDGGYVLLAWPESTSPTAIYGMISDNLGAQATSATATYDLYSYDESEDKEWLNYRKNSFGLVPGKGYLYASKDGVTLTYEGEANPEFADVDNLPYTENNLVKSLYLAGNSKTTTETFYVYDGENQITFNYLVMNEDGNGFTSGQGASYTAPAMTGFFVQAPGANMTLSTTDVNAKANVSLLNINVLRNRGSVIDNAIVSFSNGSMMDKFYLMNNTTRVYIPQGNREMAIANSAAQGEMPVSFRASENGTYTIAVEAENVDMNYLHLIDNMTGMDVDLLQTPSYTFEANTNDYANRFKLVFAANGTDEADESSFAFFSNGNLIVNNEGNATLQVIDINGRILSSETISGSCSKAINATTGVYMLRLINGENVKVQKVVVR